MDKETMERIEDLERVVGHLGSNRDAVTYDETPSAGFAWDRVTIRAYRLDAGAKLTREPVCVIRGVDYYEGDTMMHRNITGVLADVVKDDLEALIVRRQDTGKEVTWLKHHTALYARADERTDG
jgi:hypothetical protein